MKIWNDIEGSTLFNKVFTCPINIGQITLNSLVIDNDIPKIVLSFDISEIPDNPPEKWVKMGFNTCRIGLNCGGVSDTLIKNLPSNEKMEITIKKQLDYYLVRAWSPSSLIEFKTKYPFLSGPSVYFDSEI